MHGLCGRGFWARGSLIMAVSTLVMTTSALCVKLLGDRVPLFEIVVRGRRAALGMRACGAASVQALLPFAGAVVQTCQ
jgi:hypothetical protein